MLYYPHMNEKPTTYPTSLIFLHGRESSSQGYKARLLRRLFPTIITPDFHGTLEQRMEQLDPHLASAPSWTIIGSSFGGLMAAQRATTHPHQIQRLILLAPALTHPAFADSPPPPIAIPTTIYHGQRDLIIPLAQTRALAERVFTHLTFHTVDDDHPLRTTVQTLDWAAQLWD